MNKYLIRQKVGRRLSVVGEMTKTLKQFMVIENLSGKRPRGQGKIKT